MPVRFASALILVCWCPLAVAVGAEPVRFAIAIHGGVASKPMEAKVRAEREQVLGDALDVGAKVLSEGGTALDAVEQVIRKLEDDPRFNAGRGAVLNAAGGHELDASIMDGRTKACGAVAGVRTVKNPISLARLVMTRTRHVLLAGDGAEVFAGQMEVARVPQSYFTTDRARASLKRVQQEEQQKQQQPSRNGGAARRERAPSRHLGTVGCVVLDSHGNLAAGTSTGGLTNKRYGRVGDSPIVGAGTYADNASCAVSCTGVGEHFIRHAVAHEISARMRLQKVSLQEAARGVVHDVLKPGTGGVISVDHRGLVTADFNTHGMSRAWRDIDGKRVVIVGR